MRRGAAAVLVLVIGLAAAPAALAVLPGAAAGAAPAAGGGAAMVPARSGAAAPGPAASGGATLAPAAAEDGNVTMVIQLRPDGDARWTVTTNVTLESPEDRAAFERLGRRWNNGTVDVGYDVDLFRRFAGLASNATGRPMTIPEGSVDRDWEVVDNGTGTLSLSFTWTNFGVVEDGRLVVDDAFDAPDGTWLPRLEAGQRLVIRPPAGFTVVQSPPGPALVDGSMTWTGPESFAPGYFRIVYESNRGPTPSPTPSPESPPDTPVGPFQLSPGVLLGVAGAVLLGGALAVYRVLGGDGGLDDGGAPAAGAGGDGGAAAGTATDGAAADPYDGVDPELLSDEERVLRLLEANGGRMKQARIVAETGWSNAKVSQLLSGMDDDDRIDKLRIGRENLISLPDIDVEGG